MLEISTKEPHISHIIFAYKNSHLQLEMLISMSGYYDTGFAN